MGRAAAVLAAIPVLAAVMGTKAHRTGLFRAAGGARGWRLIASAPPLRRLDRADEERRQVQARLETLMVWTSGNRGAKLARNQVRFGLRQAAQCGGAAANASGERRPGQAAASESLQAPPGLAGSPAPVGPSEPRSNTGGQGARPG